MLLVHQAGAVKVGEVVRYTVTYTPSSDRILPSPSHLHVKIKNTSAIPLRAAYLHGPYTLHVASYPSTFNPNERFESFREDGPPVYEPNLKAGGHWHAKLVIPERIRESGDRANIKRNTDGSARTVTWIIEVASQILFSNTASVHFELLIGRDARSLELGFAAVAGKGHGEPGQVQDYKHIDSQAPGRQPHPKGVYSRAINLVVEDTAALWNKPALPKWEVEKEVQEVTKGPGTAQPRKKRKLHVVILTHGLHSNLGADLLYMKESIDESVRKVQEMSKERREAAKKSNQRKKQPSTPKSPQSNTNQSKQESSAEDDDSDDEQVIVRGFPGNSVRTERGIQYLGKRLAKYVLTLTYPDQPVLPTSKSIAKSFSNSFSSATRKFSTPGKSSQSEDASEQQVLPKRLDLPYTYSSISFIGHSLGGLVQTYAIAYIQKHSPEFFERIKPVNFVALATPFLGLSNENPLYVKFALDFGLVGRTGQDLGLTWRAPNVARTGWSAMISGLGAGNNTQEQPREEDPRAKPLLRILPSGPAHEVLKKFRNRTVYSNVVNDGIVPLRTSCLLFLDWRGLGKVENARRENGLIGTMAAFGWAELTGANSVSHRPTTARPEDDDEDSSSEMQRSGRSTRDGQRKNSEIPASPADETTKSESKELPSDRQFLSGAQDEEQQPHEGGNVPKIPDVGEDTNDSTLKAYTLPNNPLTDFINLFRPSPAKSQGSSSHKISNKAAKTYRRAQTIKQDYSHRHEEAEEAEEAPAEEKKSSSSNSEDKAGVARGESFLEDPNAAPPPKTSIFDAAGDILNPPLPAESWLIDPSKRDRTIFHDRIYHPDDIPLPPPKRPKLPRSVSSTGSLRSNARSQSTGDPPGEGTGMKVEEKIARAYHNGMSWRKVLVRLEPDAHNNLIVRRMFANAYGWDVVKHLCDTHFGDTYASNTRDEFLGNEDIANSLTVPGTKYGSQVAAQTSVRRPRSASELREETDKVAELETGIEARGSLTSTTVHPTLRTSSSQDSATWNDSFFDDDGNDADDTDDEASGPFESFQRFWARSPKPEGRERQGNQSHDPKLAVETEKTEKNKDRQGSSQAEIAEYLTLSPQKTNTEAHQGAEIFKPQSAVHSTYQSNSIEALEAEDALPSKTGDDQAGGRNTSDLGLQKPPEAHISNDPSTEVEKSVSEQVAKASTPSKNADA